MVCYFLFWLLKPYYVFKSGSVQPGDAFLAVAVFLLLCYDRFVIHLRKQDKFLYLFFLCIFLVNFGYFVAYAETSFLKCLLYYVFNLLAVYMFRSLCTMPRFYTYFSAILKFNLFAQLILLLTGVGSWYTAGRYMGTYNDPNQLAFGIMSTYCLLFCISRLMPVKRRWLYFAMAAYLIYQSSSTGMLVAIAILFVCEQYFRLVSIKGNFNRACYIVYLLLITIVFLLLGIELVRILASGETEVPFLRRFAGKLDKGDSFIESFIKDRNLTAVVNKPVYFLFGSGETKMSRFASSKGELHSTWIGLLFYYGIIPFCVLIAWIRSNMRNIDWYVIPVYLCLFAEALTLVNHRQPSFWTLIALAAVINRKTTASVLPTSN